MKKEEAEKVKELYTTHWLIDEFNKEIDAMVDPVPARPKTGDTVRIKSIQEIAKTGRKFLHGRPEDWTKSMDCTCGKIGKIIDISIMLPDYRAVEFDDGEIWRYNLLDFDPEPEPVRPPQKVKVGEWMYRIGDKEIHQCTEIEWDDTTIGQHWHYRSNGKYIGDDTSIRKVLHLQLADEDRPFEVGDRVEWDEGNNIRHGMIVEIINNKSVNVYQFINHGAWWMDIARLRFANWRER
jgi:hypothetical protein